MLDVGGGSAAEGAILQMYHRNGMQPQNFKLTFDKNSGYYTIRASYVDKYVSAQNNGTDDRTRIVLNSWNGSCGQYWKIVKKDNGTYNIFNKCSDKALDVNGGFVYLGNTVQLWTNNNLGPQEWKFENTSSVMRPLDDGVYSIASVLRSNYMLDVSGGIYTNGRNIQMWQRNNLQPQMFRITRSNHTMAINILTSPAHAQQTERMFSYGLGLVPVHNIGRLCQLKLVRIIFSTNVRVSHSMLAVDAQRLALMFKSGK